MFCFLATSQQFTTSDDSLGGQFLTGGWSAARDGGFKRNGGLSKSEDIQGKRPFSSVFPWIFLALFGPSGKGRKIGRKRPKKADFGRSPGRQARHPLSPHLLHPHLRQFLTGGTERGVRDICVASACACAPYTDDTHVSPQTTLLCRKQCSLRHLRVICLSQRKNQRCAPAE